eukprot:TRINITY_DN1844_c0_g1_i1.p1 TRINITY_DN1844_c0_g1~~TRINITY_DN1844_c0_g1_i1.p1  ORF type:complete len:391 (+),score=43.45 TRINITY_DN1844_c0_g1_i1:346-1518(+)
MFDFDIQHVKGTLLSHADAFSRGPVDEPEPNPDETDKLICFALTDLSPHENELHEAVKRDDLLSSAIEAAHSGDWSKVPPGPLMNKRNQLSVKDDLMFWGIRLVVPSSLRSKFLEELHLSHRGIVKMKALVRCNFWWPGIDGDIEDKVSTCKTCQENSPSPPSEFTPFEPSVEWERVHIDYAKINGRDVLVLVDAGSKWIEATYMSSVHTLNQLLSWFCRFGFPHTIHSDNGPQFVNHIFQAKLQSWGVKESLSPPYHPQSNGQAERAVRVVKDLIKKNPNIPLDQLLFSYRATPLSGGSSPAELLLSKPLRTRIDGFLPRHSSSSSSHHPNASKFTPNVDVWCRSFNKRTAKWIPGKAISSVGNSLWLVKVDGGTHTRHINQLRLRRSL